MPYTIDRPVKRLAALASACLSVLVCAAPAAAQSWSSQYQQYQPSAPNSSGCPAQSSSPLFSSLGDPGSYTLLPDGAFQASAAGWTLNGASVVPGGEPWNVSQSANQQSLSIPAGSYAVSPTICVTNQFPSWRFFAQAVNASWGTQLQVTALYADINGYTGTRNAAFLSGNDYGSWQATPVLAFGSAVPAGDTVNVRLVFSAAGPGAWNIDDLAVDPYSR